MGPHSPCNFTSGSSPTPWGSVRLLDQVHERIRHAHNNCAARSGRRPICREP